MKKVLVIVAMGLFGMAAHAADYEEATPISAEGKGRVWACMLQFNGVSKGVQVIVGKFKTTAYGLLDCYSVHGEHYARNVKVEIGSRLIGLTVGAGYFKIKGISSEISLFNQTPDVILGNYTATHYEAAVGVGAGYFTASKLGCPQFAYNVSFHLNAGAGVKVGMERMRITAVDGNDPGVSSSDDSTDQALN
jgi:hypothetical protein